MFYFVPYWYGESKAKTFDDTVNQIRMFEAVHENSETIICEYSPQIRCFLHQQNLSLNKYWSVFDMIQNIEDVNNKIVDFNDLSWPIESEFVYTPFRVNVILAGKTFANISFGLESQLSSVSYFDDDHISKTLIFDDRGFLSSIIYFSAGKKTVQEYLDVSGIWQIRVTYLTESEKIVINPMSYHRFKKSTYHSLNDLIQEMINYHFANESDLKHATLIIAANEKYNQLLLNLSYRPSNLVLSFFKNRYEYKKNEQLLIDELSLADIVIADTIGQLEDIKEIVVAKNNSHLVNKLQHITPYDTRFQLGISQQYKELTILLNTQELSKEEIIFVLCTILSCMADNNLIALSIACSEENNAEKIDDYIKQVLVGYYHLDNNVILNDLQMDNTTDENKLENRDNDGDTQQPVWVNLYKRISMHTFQTENDMIQAFENVRLIIDVSHRPNIYTQIAGISAGIPQINLSASPYIINQQNGLIIQDLSELKKAIDYYLIGLSHWNTALVYAVQQMRQYTNGAIVRKWRHILGEENG